MKALLAPLFLFPLGTAQPTENAPPAVQSPSIVVNIGDYPSALAAANDEENVNWLDSDATDDTLCTECFAASELQRYLRKTSAPGRFPIFDDDRVPLGDLIVVGNPASNEVARRYADQIGPLDGLGEDGFRVRTLTLDGRKILFLTGKERVGSLRAAYDFLEWVGVRWLGPGDLNEEIRTRKLTKLPDLNQLKKPAFSTRGFWTWEDRGTREFLLWMARQKMNFWCVENAHKPMMKKLGLHLTCGGHQIQWRFLNPQHPYPYNCAAFQGDENNPADPNPPGEYQGDLNKDGFLSYSEVHPEWFGLQGGKRSFRIEHDFGDNFCTSNEGALAEFVKNIVRDFIDGQWAWADSINLWMLDNGRWCACDRCAALGTYTDRNILVVHRLRKEIQKAIDEGSLRRNVTVFFLAYADVIAPPSRPLPEDFDYENCIATFFPIVRCYVHPFDFPLCTELNARYREHYAGWAIDPQRHYRGQLCIGEYYNVSAHKNLPIPFMRVMAEDIPYFYRTGARHMHYMHVSVANWGTKCLTNYQFAKMLWDPSLDTAKLWDDYLDARYKSAADRMRAFYMTLHRGMANITLWKYNLARRLSADADELFPTTHLKYEAQPFIKDDGPDVLETVAAVRRCRRQIDRVMAMKLPARYLARLEEDEALFAYAENTVHFYNHLIRVHQAIRRGDEDAARDEFQKAAVFAERLKSDTKSTQFASSHANAKNAFEASYVTQAYARYLERFGDPAEPKRP